VTERRPAAAETPAAETPPPTASQPTTEPRATELRAGSLMWRAFLSWLRSLTGKRESSK
jgi:hypothetical protein